MSKELKNEYCSGAAKVEVTRRMRSDTSCSTYLGERPVSTGAALTGAGLAAALGQRLTLVRFSAQLEPCLSQGNTYTP